MALDFGGTNDFLANTSLSSAFNMTGGATVQAFTAWLNNDSFGGNQWDDYVFYLSEDTSATGDGWGLTMGNESGTIGATVFTIGGNSGHQATGVTAGNWFHCLAIYDQANTTLQLYIDNVQKYSDGAYADESAITSAEILIGIDADEVSNEWNGKMADVAFLSAVPSVGQRKALSLGYAPILVMPNNVIEYWDFVREADARLDSTNDLTITGTISASPQPSNIYPAILPPLVGKFRGNPWYVYAQQGGM